MLRLRVHPRVPCLLARPSAGLGCGERLRVNPVWRGLALAGANMEVLGRDAQGTLHELSVPTPSGRSFGSAFLCMAGSPSSAKAWGGCLPWEGGSQLVLVAPKPASLLHVR